MEYFVLELGLSATCPFEYSFQAFGPLVTHCWLKTLWEKCDRFKIRVTINNLKIKPPRTGDKFFVQALVDEGYKGEELIRLNKVRIHQQVLYLSDVLNANGRSVDLKYLDRREDSSWSTYNFAEEHFTEADLVLWRAAVYSLSPASRPMLRVGGYQLTSHKIWEWRYNDAEQKLLFWRQWDGLVDIYVPSNLPGARGRANQWMLLQEAQRVPFLGELCSTKRTAEDAVAIQCTTVESPEEAEPTGFLEVLEREGGKWMWDDLTVTGDRDWIVSAIRESTVLAVTDGSFMEELFPDVCSAAFILECSEGRGTITGSFTERSEDACAYRGEIMGLMAIQLILAGVHRSSEVNMGNVDIHCDCLGALGMVKNIPQTRIPTRCKHLDVLKNILVNCGNFDFGCSFYHVEAHQDDSTPFQLLDRPAQLNCMMDTKAKEAIRRLHQGRTIPLQRPFPMEPLTIFAGTEKITTDSGEVVQFCAHKQLARPIFAKRKVLDGEAFALVEWKSFWEALRETPRLFQLWACKQIMSIAATNKARARFTTDLSPLCPSCMVEEETCAHILKCTEQGRVNALDSSIGILDQWLSSTNAEPQLHYCLVTYARARGTCPMSELCFGMQQYIREFARAQDTIGWRRFMEGMVASKIKGIQKNYWTSIGWQGGIEKWMHTLITKLLECMHGQWLYRNVMVHDKLCGSLAARWKEQLLEEVEKQLENEGELLPEDQYLMEINLGDITQCSGESHAYWLLAIQAARVAKTLSLETQGIG
jgi:hypothetical protein